MKQQPWSGYEIGGLTELRIHGAGATPIDEMLDASTYVRVAGDDTAGFYRVPAPDQPDVKDRSDPRYAAHNVATAQDPDQPGEVEAYYWGKFSSGGGWKAFWVLLLPFALVNLAGWNAPRKAWFTRALVRIFALLLSVTFAWWFTSAILAVLAECGPGTLCSERQFFLGFTGMAWFDDQPARVVIVGLAVGSLASLALWWWPGRKTADTYERYSGNEPAPDQPLSQLESDGTSLWHSEGFSEWLGGIHLLAMLAAIAAGALASVGSTRRVTPWPFGSTDLYISLPRDQGPIAVLVVCCLLIAACFVAVVWLDSLAKNRRGTMERLLATSGKPKHLAILGVILVVTSCVFVALPGTQTSSDLLKQVSIRQFYFSFANTGYLILISGIILVLGALLVWRVAVVIAQALGRKAEARRHVLFGIGPPIVLGTSLVIMAAMLTGGVLWVTDVIGEADYEIPAIQTIDGLRADAVDKLAVVQDLDLDDDITQREFTIIQEAIDASGRLRDLEADLGEPLIRLGVVYYLMPLAFMVIVVVGAILAGLIYGAAAVRMRSTGLMATGLIDREIVAEVNRRRASDGPGRGKLNVEMASLLRKPYRNRRLHYLLVVPAAMVFVVVPIAVFAFGAVLDVAGVIDALVRPSIWLTVGVFVALGLVIRDHYRGGASRGALGGMWDIITFWPRFYHPFAPPSYAVRAVPEIAERAKELVGRENSNKVLLSAHSQGVPTTLAAFATIGAVETRNRIALLTYGSPTGMLYGRFFPDYFDANQLRELSGGLRVQGGCVRWTNLWRLGDWTGGYVSAEVPSKDRYFQYLDQFALGRASGRRLASLGEAEPMFASSIIPLTTEGVAEARLIDPDPFSIVGISNTDPLPSPIGHGDYLHDRLYPEYRTELIRAIESPATPPVPSPISIPSVALTDDSGDGAWQEIWDGDVRAASRATATSILLEAGRVYKVVAPSTVSWIDCFYSSGPEGRNPWWMRLYGPLKRHRGSSWMQLVSSVDGKESSAFQPDAVLVPALDGELMLYPNDVSFMYWNNRGSIHVQVLVDAGNRRT